MDSEIHRFEHGELVGFNSGAIVAPKPPAWPTPDQQQQDPHWTARIARPAQGDCEDHLLERRQQQWDDAEQKRLYYEEGVAERQATRDAAAKDEAAKQAARLDAERQQAAAVREDQLKHAFHANGGTEAEWQREREEIVRIDRQRRTVEDAGPVLGSLISKEQAVLG